MHICVISKFGSYNRNIRNIWSALELEKEVVVKVGNWQYIRETILSGFCHVHHVFSAEFPTLCYSFVCHCLHPQSILIRQQYMDRYEDCPLGGQYICTARWKFHGARGNYTHFLMIKMNFSISQILLLLLLLSLFEGLQLVK